MAVRPCLGKKILEGSFLLTLLLLPICCRLFTQVHYTFFALAYKSELWKHVLVNTLIFSFFHLSCNYVATVLLSKRGRAVQIESLLTAWSVSISFVFCQAQTDASKIKSYLMSFFFCNCTSSCCVSTPSPKVQQNVS